MLLDQLEYYSRIPSHVDLIVVKFLVHLKAGRFEEALQNYQFLSYFEKSLTNELLFLTTRAVRAMLILGYHIEAIELVEKFKDKYGDIAWEKLLQETKEHVVNIKK